MIIEGEGVVDSLASKFITSPALISGTPVNDEFASDVFQQSESLMKGRYIQKLKPTISYNIQRR